MSSTPARLDALPAETFEQITRYVHEKDLLSLRLVCRETALKTQREFAKAHFTHRAVLLSGKRSLQRALEVAKHPCFGPSLQVLNIVIAELPEPHTWERAGRFKEKPHHLEILQAAYRRQEELRSSGGDLNALTTLFSRLRMYGKVQRIEFSDTPTVLHRPSLSREIDDVPDHLLYKAFEPPGIESNRPFSIPMEALTLSCLSITQIEMDTEWCFGLHLFSEEQASWLSGPLQHATSVSLKTWADRAKPESSQTGAARLCKALTEALKLQHLSLQVQWWEEDAIFDTSSLEDHVLMDYLLVVTLPRLEKLKLDGPYIKEYALRQFGRQNPQLQSLELRDFILEVDLMDYDHLRSLGGARQDGLCSMLEERTGIQRVRISGSDWDIV